MTNYDSEEITNLIKDYFKNRNKMEIYQSNAFKLARSFDYKIIYYSAFYSYYLLLTDREN